MQPTLQSCYNGLEGGEGDVSSVLAFHIMFLSLSSLNVHLLDDDDGAGVEYRRRRQHSFHEESRQLQPSPPAHP